MRRVLWSGVVMLLLWGLLFQAGCGGDSTVFIPGCESCQERCLILKEGASGRCVACLKDEQCRDNDSSTKVCTKDNRCVCGSDKDCSKGLYCVGERGCVECKNNEQCASSNPDKPVCIANRCEVCEPNSQRACAPDGATVCKKGTQTCKANNSWGECKNTWVCKSGEKCENEACVPDCPPAPCKEGELQCVSKAGEVPGSFKKCIKNTRGCLEWDKNTACGTKEVCSKGQCTPYTCPAAECVEKDTQCVGDGAFRTCVKNKLGCIVWSEKTPCKSTEKCQKGLQKCAACNPKDSRDCYDGPTGTGGKGLCKNGTQVCKDDGSGFGSCVGAIKPTKELCDSKDNDCDGAVDEDFADKGKTCSTGQGACKQSGQQVCKKDGSGVECDAKAGTPGKELCNNKDDNCDGKIDENLTRTCYTGAGGTAGKGLCKSGTQTCKSGVYGSCVGEVKPAVEVCNGKDDDCNGSIDNAVPGTGKSCSVPGQKGPCAQGSTACIQGKSLCQQQVKATTEICNNKDDDCNGSIDDGVTRSCYSGTIGTAGKGVCKAGVQTCKNGAFGGCVGEIKPSAEVCNKKDDDCDGKVDEDTAGTGSVCIVCGDGKKQGSEECDDNNRKPLDGCSATCKLELGTKGKPALSCKAILDAKVSRGNGTYWLKPIGSTTAYEVYCDMATDGGGWTHIFTISSTDANNWIYTNPIWTNTTPLSTFAKRTQGDFKSPGYAGVLGTDFLIRNAAKRTEYIGWKALFTRSTFQAQVSSSRNYLSKPYNLKGATLPLPWAANAFYKGIFFSRTHWNSGGDCTYNLRITNGDGGNASTGLDGKGWGRTMTKTTLTVCGNSDIGYPPTSANSNPVGVFLFYIR